MWTLNFWVSASRSLRLRRVIIGPARLLADQPLSAGGSF